MKRKPLLIGCGIALACGLLVALAAGLWIAHVIQDPQDMVVLIEGPTTVTVGEEFLMTVVVRNLRQTEPIDLTDIDIDESYLDHFLVLGLRPPAVSDSHVPGFNQRSYTFDLAISPQGTRRFEFRLRPVETGFFRGDVDVYDGSLFLTTLLQTEVVAAAGSPPAPGD